MWTRTRMRTSLPLAASRTSRCKSRGLGLATRSTSLASGAHGFLCPSIDGALVARYLHDGNRGGVNPCLRRSAEGPRRRMLASCKAPHFGVGVCQAWPRWGGGAGAGRVNSQSGLGAAESHACIGDIKRP